LNRKRGLSHTFATGERQYSVFQAAFNHIFASEVSGYNCPDGVGMLRFRHLA